MPTLLTGRTVLPARDHALPFRVLLEELLQRREDDVLKVAACLQDRPDAPGSTPFLELDRARLPDVQKPTVGLDKGQALAKLQQALHDQEAAYERLQVRQAFIRAGQDLRLDEELERCAEADRPLKQILHAIPRSALCLSGGGIRSASFSLGIMEGLARFSRDTREDHTGVMDGLDYLSTVSGGGYIGSWLMSWVWRRYRLNEEQNQPTRPPGSGEPDLHAQQEANWKQAYAKVVSTLAGQQNLPLPGSGVPQPESVTGGDPEPQAKRHLRSYTSFLAPALGATLDTATLGAVLLRNLLVNWVMLVPLLVACLAAARGLGRWLLWRETMFQPVSSIPWLGVGLAALFVAAVVVAAIRLSPRAPGPRSRSGTVTAWQWLPSLLSSVAGPACFVLAVALIPVIPSQILEAACLLAAAFIAAIELPSHDAERSLARDKTVTSFDRFKEALRPNAGYAFIGFVLLGSAALTVSQPRGHIESFAWVSVETIVALLGFGTLAFSIAAAETNRLTASQTAMEKKAGHLQGSMRAQFRGRLFWIWPAALGATVFSAILTCGLLFGLHNSGVYDWLLGLARLDLPYLSAVDSRFFIVLCPPVVIALLLVSTTMLCALLGVMERDEDREWWVRCGGALLGVSIGWVVVEALVFYGAGAHRWFWKTVAGLLLTGLCSFLGFSGATAGADSESAVSKLKGVGLFLYKHKLLLPLLGSLGVLLIGTGLVALEESLRKGPVASLLAMLGNRAVTPGVPALGAPASRALASGALASGHAAPTPFYLLPWEHVHSFLFVELPRHPDGGAALLLFVLAAVLTFLLNRAINVNLFSLQGIYRMRLMRAYLGASNVFRRPDPFTGFDPRDTPRMYQMPCTPGVPVHLVNCTLNLTGTTNTAWRQRRAENFTFNPVVCGSWRTGYVCTTDYASRHNGPDLAAAMSISGSAFNPNMGYHTSPLLSVLMTFFDVRLGAWLPNPAWPALQGWSGDEARVTSFFHRPGPRLALSPLVQELLGSADDTRPYVELTDGGHFENLGLYEMVMRRVQTVIVVDAGADPDYQFEDLGNAVRKIQIDLGVTIEFGDAMPMKSGMDESNLYCVLGTIRYGCVDQEPGCDGKDYDGTLLYIKPVLTGKEPADIFQYARTHGTFPNETTVNQFFNEAQFESYRHLGSYSLDKIVKAPMAAHKRPADYGTLASLLHYAARFGKTLKSPTKPS